MTHSINNFRNYSNFKAMYDIPIYKEEDEKKILQFLKENPFVLITGVDSKGKPVATQIPICIEKRGEELYLLGHLMKATDHYKAFIENKNVLAVATGANGYVSASWYSNSNKASTWNYMSVHMQGTLTYFEGEQLVTLMKRFTLEHEGGKTTSPTIYDNLPKKYINRLMPQIIGFEIKVEQLDTVFKLSQELDKESYSNVIHKLEEKGGTNAILALAMKKRI